MSITSFPSLSWASSPGRASLMGLHSRGSHPCFWLPRLLLWSETHRFYWESAPSSPSSPVMWFWRDEYLVLSCLASQSPPGHFYSKLRSESVAPLLQRKARQTPMEQQSRRWSERIPRVSLLSSNPVLPDVGLALVLPSLGTSESSFVLKLR